MDIKVYDRENKEYIKEKVAGEKFLDFLYDNRVGVMMRESLVKRKIFQAIAGKYCDSSLSKRNINKFVKKQNIDPNESIMPPFTFDTFNDFFVRKLKPESRPINMKDNVLISPGDGRLLVTENISKDHIVQVKGIEYSLTDLLDSEQEAKNYEGGTMMVLRLNPSDYHRFHFVDSGIPSPIKKIEGSYYSVNPIALKNIANLYLQNKREWCILKSNNFKNVLCVEIGATSVGTIVQTFAPMTKVKKGQEKGYFKFGGSTTILFFQKDTVIFDSDILEQSKQQIETKVKMGEKIGITYDSLKEV